ncbi:hypothetical protein CC86DRAFT_450399 [Ophiobolus disseminans]|uniref:Uncharacterized protein n=1 Tax=Ophiobolus disseminans TaxID=1469910 RepID=A0A6A6ZCK0_9PLEO|nr:hypothetical protein CC86DRAFT_450399 [Ophiobolus disseminans]
MTSKRKRSDDDSPLSVSSWGSISSSDAHSPSPFTHPSTDMDVDATARHNGWDFASASRVKGGDWGNRTSKRVRDNRPDERAIHENTLHKLFAAQRNHVEASALPSDVTPVQQPTQAIAKPQKSTLHSFWKQLPTPPVQPSIFSALPPPQRFDAQSPRCEDCDASLQSVNDSMDVDMDVDMSGAVESNIFACSDCGKNVCGTCAVVSTRRHCLQCATNGRNSRRWW